MKNPPMLFWIACLCVYFVLGLASYSQVPDNHPATTWADVTEAPGQTIVILRDTKGADEVIVTTFFWQTVPGIEKPIMRAVTDVAAALKDTAVAVNSGTQDPSKVTTVHISLVKITDRMEWSPSVAKSQDSPK